MKFVGRRMVAVGAVAVIATAACTRSTTELATPRTTVGSPTTIAATATSAPSEASTEGDPVEVSTTVAAPGTTHASPTTFAPIETAAPVSVVDIDEVGTPGLDSDDAFCAAWSRFAGSFQVVAVTAAFGSGSSEQLAALEVAASPVVTESYEELFANWPDELEPEEDMVADDFLGPFHRRLLEARDALERSGADAATIDAIASAWVEGLARRDPSTPEFAIDLSDEQWALIDAAAVEFAGSRVPFGSDPSLTTEVSPTLTNEFLALRCPDQGTLGGQEVDAP